MATFNEAVKYLRDHFWRSEMGMNLTTTGGTTTDSWRESITGNLHVNSEPTLENTFVSNCGPDQYGHPWIGWNSIPAEYITPIINNYQGWHASIHLIYQGRHKRKKRSKHGSSQTTRYSFTSGIWQWDHFLKNDETAYPVNHATVPLNVPVISQMVTPMHFTNLTDIYWTDYASGPKGRHAVWPVSTEVSHINDILGYGIPRPNYPVVGWRYATMVNGAIKKYYTNMGHMYLLYDPALYAPLNYTGFNNLQPGYQREITLTNNTIFASNLWLENLNLTQFAQRFMKRTNTPRFNYCFALVIYEDVADYFSSGVPVYQPRIVIYSPLQVIERDYNYTSGNNYVVVQKFENNDWVQTSDYKIVVTFDNMSDGHGHTFIQDSSNCYVTVHAYTRGTSGSSWESITPDDVNWTNHTVTFEPRELLVYAYVEFHFNKLY